MRLVVVSEKLFRTVLYHFVLYSQTICLQDALEEILRLEQEVH
jgi:hypothetical protein